MSARAEADTPENSKSSRGHAILTLEVCIHSSMPGGNFSSAFDVRARVF